MTGRRHPNATANADRLRTYGTQPGTSGASRPTAEENRANLQRFLARRPRPTTRPDTGSIR